MNRIGLIVVSLLLSIGCSKLEQNYTSVRDIAYDDFPQTKVDIYSPLKSTQNNPVLIYVHGGGWSSGDKTEWDAQKVEYFCNLGYTCVSVNYRLSPDVKHPIHIQDVANAINWVEDNIALYGGNASEIVLIGHSAGAHLVALAVTNQKYIEKAGVDIFNIKKAYLLDAGAYLIMNDLVYEDSTILDMIYGAIGDNSNHEIWADFAPVNHIDSGKYMPFLVIVHSDTPYRVAVNRIFCDKLELCSKKYVQYTLDGYSHSDVLSKIPTYFDEFSLI